MLTRKRAVLGLGLIAILVAIPAVLKIEADRKLRSALAQINASLKINTSLTRTDLERLDPDSDKEFKDLLIEVTER